MDAALTRVGIFEYRGPAGETIREYRPREEVMKADSLATLADAPVTNRHPPGKVTAKNYRAYTVGHVSGEARADGDLVVARLAVQDETVLSAVEQGKQREVSCGYTCDLDETPGVLVDGSRYDKIQRNIRYNHVAIVERGRAGRDVALRLDAEGNETLTEDTDTMTEAEIKALRDSLAAEKLRADKAEGELAVARTETAAEKTRADAAMAPAAVDALVKARVELVTKASAVLGATFKADGLDELTIKTAVAAKAFPAVDLKDKPAAFIEPLFIAATSKPAAAPAVKLDSATADLRSAVTPTETPAAAPKSLEARKAQHRKDSEEAAKRPLAVSK